MGYDWAMGKRAWLVMRNDGEHGDVPVFVCDSEQDARRAMRQAAVAESTARGEEVRSVECVNGDDLECVGAVTFSFQPIERWIVSA